MIFKDNESVGVAFADEGLWEVADFLKRPIHLTYRGEWDARTEGYDRHGGLTQSEAVRVAQEGWHEGTQMVHDLLTGVALLENKPGISNTRLDVAGHIPDIGRYLSGDPAHMIRHTRRDGAHPVIHIVVNTALAGSSTAKQQTNYGVGMCGLIDWLEASGKRVELDRLGVVQNSGGIYLRDGGKRSFQGWKVKRAADPLDLSSVVFALAHAASHRHLVWGMRRRMSKVTWMPKQVLQEDVAHIGAEGAFIVDSVLDAGLQCETVAGACLLAAKRLNDAAGEDLCDMEALRDALKEKLYA